MKLQKQAPISDVVRHRKQKREEFLRSLNLEHVTMEPLQADASFRRYYRLKGTATPMLLMEDPPDRPPVPPFVMVEPYIKIADHLRSLGLRAPEIYFRDIQNGLLVIEDFGDHTYTRAFNEGHDPKPLYELAVDVLIHLHRHPQRLKIELPAYNNRLLVDEAMLLLDWYYPALTGKKPSEEMKQSFALVWEELFKKLPGDQQTLVLRDYHVDNLMLVRGAQGIQSCGLLDFQDAVIGQYSYDLMSLLEDARRDMPPDLKDHLYERYIKGMGTGLDRAGFSYSFCILAAQRHAKVLGIFVRLFARDGKDRYLGFIPHVHKLFLQSLDDEVLAPLRKWFGKNGIDIRSPLKMPDNEKRS